MLAAAVTAYQAALGPRLVAGYALGSLAHGGFSPLVSDVDLGLILRDPGQLSDRLTMRRVARTIQARGPALAERLSVFWAAPSTWSAPSTWTAPQTWPGLARGGRFPPLDRLDLLEHGRLLAGQDARAGLERPGPDELLVAGAQFALRNVGGAASLPARLRGLVRPGPQAGHALDDIRDPARLVSRGPRRLTKVVLFPVRFLFTAATGQVGTNQAAAEHYLARASPPAAELITAALGWRREPPADDAAAVTLLRRELIPLYTSYLDDHIGRLTAIGAHQLAARFGRWRGRLLT